MSETPEFPETPQQISSILDILIAEGVITQSYAEQLTVEANQQKISVPEYLLAQKIIPTSKELIRYVAKTFKLGFVDLSDYPIDKALSKIIPVDIAKEQNIIPIHLSGSKLSVAVPIDQGMNLNLNDSLRRSTKLTYIEFLVAPADEIANAINDLYRVDEELSRITTNAEQETQAENSVDSINEEEVIFDESRAERFVRLAILQGIADRASDILFQARENELVLRYRIDGMFHEKTVVPSAIVDEIISVIKIQSNLDISIRKRAQDGRMFVMSEGDKVDLRVNIFPVQDGENVTMRVLDNSQANMRLDHLGFSAHNLERFRRGLLKPYGMILLTGPTGSGKSVTLYSALREIANETVNTLTIEDPIEYRVPHVTQSQLNTKQGWTYPEAIRAFMRAAPNNILVGEIRDFDTGSVALQAGMTGHLVLSTLHTNSAAEVPARLMDLGIQAHIIASTLTTLVGQRLIRKLCKCKVEYIPEPSELLAVDFPWQEGEPLPKLYGPSERGCKECSYLGFRGRTAAHEVLLVTKEIATLISKHAEASEIEALAKEDGMTLMIDDGWQKVLAGVTTIPEVLKAII